jgi:hypothetical protein
MKADGMKRVNNDLGPAAHQTNPRASRNDLPDWNGGEGLLQLFDSNCSLQSLEIRQEGSGLGWRAKEESSKIVQYAQPFSWLSPVATGPFPWQIA